MDRAAGYGDTDARVQGVLTWTPPPSPWLVWPLYLATALLGAAAGLLARTARPLGGLMLVGAAAALWHAGATPVPALSVSSHTGAILAALLPALTAALVAGLGFRAARRGRGAMAGLFAVVLGWLLLVQGLPDVDVLWSANVLTNGPEAVGRIAVALLLALGAGLMVGGIAAVRRFREVAVPGARDGSGLTASCGQATDRNCGVSAGECRRFLLGHLGLVPLRDGQVDDDREDRGEEQQARPCRAQARGPRRPSAATGSRRATRRAGG